jgi:hypothetical protein
VTCSMRIRRSWIREGDEAHAAVPPRLLNPCNTIVARTEGYTYAA